MHKSMREVSCLGGWSRCIKELVRPARQLPPITKLIRNQETTVRYIIRELWCIKFLLGLKML